MVRDYAKDYTLMFGGYIQGRFSRATDVGGIDLHLHVNDEGTHGTYKGSELTFSFTEDLRRLSFRLTIKTPAKSRLVEETETSSRDKISRVIGRTTVERKKSHPDSHHHTYTAVCSISPTLDHIKSPNDVFYELWEYLVKEPFSKL